MSLVARIVQRQQTVVGSHFSSDSSCKQTLHCEQMFIVSGNMQRRLIIIRRCFDIRSMLQWQLNVLDAATLGRGVQWCSRIIPICRCRVDAVRVLLQQKARHIYMSRETGVVQQQPAFSVSPNGTDTTIM